MSNDGGDTPQQVKTHNPFTFDTEDENYVNQRMMQIIDEDGYADEIEDDTLVGHNVSDWMCYIMGDV